MIMIMVMRLFFVVFNVAPLQPVPFFSSSRCSPYHKFHYTYTVEAVAHKKQCAEAEAKPCVYVCSAVLCAVQWAGVV